MLAKQPQIGFTVLDSSESSTVMRFNIRRGSSAAAGMAGATFLRGRIAPLTGGRFVRQSVVFPYIEPQPDPPRPDSIASRVAVFIFACGENQYAIVEVPGIRDEYLTTINPCHGDLVDVTAAPVAAFIEQMISALWINQFGHALVSLEAAFLQIRP